MAVRRERQGRIALPAARGLAAVLAAKRWSGKILGAGADRGRRSRAPRAHLALALRTPGPQRSRELWRLGVRTHSQQSAVYSPSPNRWHDFGLLGHGQGQVARGCAVPAARAGGPTAARYGRTQRVARPTGERGCGLGKGSEALVGRSRRLAGARADLPQPAGRGASCQQYC